MDTGHPICYSNLCARGWNDSEGSVRVLTMPQLLGILARGLGSKLRMVCLLLAYAKSSFLAFLVSGTGEADG